MINCNKFIRFIVLIALIPRSGCNDLTEKYH